MPIHPLIAIQQALMNEKRRGWAQHLQPQFTVQYNNIVRPTGSISFLSTTLFHIAVIRNIRSAFSSSLCFLLALSIKCKSLLPELL
jgi:hypothetical protein